MKINELIQNLDLFATSDDFAFRSDELLSRLDEQEKALLAVDAILHFMELHPSTEYGTPGPLVHFVEAFRNRGYEQLLITSIERKPTSHTVWMLNRLINGARDLGEREALIAILHDAQSHPNIDSETLQRINHFLALRNLGN